MMQKIELIVDLKSKKESSIQYYIVTQNLLCFGQQLKMKMSS